MKNPLRLDSALIISAQIEGALKKRSVPNQIEYWAELGKAVERILDLSDVYAITQGLKKITIDPVDMDAVNPEDVFNSIEKSRKSGILAEKVTKATIYYESSNSKPGLLDLVNTSTGERQTGRFVNGQFIQE